MFLQRAMTNAAKLLLLFDLKNAASNSGVRVGGGVRSPCSGRGCPWSLGAEDRCGDAAEHPPGAAGGQQRFALRNAGDAPGTSLFLQGIGKDEPCGFLSAWMCENYSRVPLRKPKCSLGRFLLHLSSGF